MASVYPLDAAFPVAPTARWPLHESANADAVPITGGANLTNVGSVGSVTGFSNGITIFDAARQWGGEGSGDRLQASDAAWNQFPGAFSVLWINKWNSLPGDWHNPFCKWNQDANGASYQARQNGSSLYWEVSPNGNGSGVKSISAGILSTGSFDLYCVIYDPSTRMAIYKNGVNQVESTSSIPSAPFNSGRNFEVGGTSTATNLVTAMDMNDLIIIKGTALSDAQALASYAAYSAATFVPQIRMFTPILAALGLAASQFMRSEHGLLIPKPAF